MGHPRQKKMTEEERMSPPIINLVGVWVGILEVCEFAGRDQVGRVLYKVRCKCGSVRTLHGFLLARKKVSDCGCLSSRRAKYEAAQRRVEAFDTTTPISDLGIWESYVSDRTLIASWNAEFGEDRSDVREAQDWIAKVRRCQELLNSGDAHLQHQTKKKLFKLLEKIK